MKIYMAGKIAKGDWRHGLVDGLTGAISLNDGAFLKKIGRYSNGRS